MYIYIYYIYIQCAFDDGLQIARNIWKCLTKYTENKFCQVGFSLNEYIEMHGQQNIKFLIYLRLQQRLTINN